MKWALEVSSQQALRELQKRTGGVVDEYLLHRMRKKHSDKMRIRIKKMGCAFLLPVFFHILMMIAMGIALLN